MNDSVSLSILTHNKIMADSPEPSLCDGELLLIDDMSCSRFICSDGELLLSVDMSCSRFICSGCFRVVMAYNDPSYNHERDVEPIDIALITEADLLQRLRMTAETDLLAIGNAETDHGQA